ncbi:hypothetical protein VM1G_11749 [Cytospora mali]|uniref:Uncharacterized protein n=1 Tax=Cytospora mali TaxID=578113 RepID=A0A194W3W9_CYTMA|nr:hypothetical protein VM1G_11749 [Valsa mali]
MAQYLEGINRFYEKTIPCSFAGGACSPAAQCNRLRMAIFSTKHQQPHGCPICDQAARDACHDLWGWHCGHAQNSQTAVGEKPSARILVINKEVRTMKIILGFMHVKIESVLIGLSWRFGVNSNALSGCSLSAHRVNTGSATPGSNELNRMHVL